MKRRLWLAATFLLAWPLLAAPRQSGAEETERWRTFDLDSVEKRRRESGRAFREFLRVADLSAGLYALEVGAEDRQRPHAEDEIYYVVSGRAKIRLDDQVEKVAGGSVIYVKADVPHRFFDIEKELKILVVFAPAFGTRVKE